MDMDLVTVIVPIYNVEKYLERCVESILKQTYQNLEIILVDDGSPDRCGEICDSFMDERIVVIHQENQGLSAARNTGLKRAKGSWITFIDSDDFIASDYVEYLLNLCKRNHVLISQCGAVRGKESVFPEETVAVREKKWDFHDLYISPTRDYRTIACGKLYHASLFQTHLFPVGKINEDEDTVFKVMYEAGSAVISNRHLYYYFMSPSSILRKKREHLNFDYVDIFNDRISFLKKRNETLLINTTIKELCIRIMLNYFEGKKSNVSVSEIKKLWDLYLHYYKQIQIAQFSLKEKCALLLFRIAPNTFAFLENHLGIIQKNKFAREKK